MQHLRPFPRIPLGPRRNSSSGNRLNGFQVESEDIANKTQTEGLTRVCFVEKLLRV